MELRSMAVATAGELNRGSGDANVPPASNAVDPHPAEAPSAPAHRPLRILFLSHYFPPEGNAPASRVHEMCRRWVRAGHHVTVITGAPNCPTGVLFEGYRNRLWQRETIDGIDVLRVWTYITANKGTVRRILSYLSYMFAAGIAALGARRPDVLIATSPQFFCGLAGAIVSELRRLPFVLEIRDLWPASIAAVGALRTRMLLKPLELLERLMYRSATRLVTVGEGYKRELRDRGVPATRMSVIPNGVDRELFVPTEPDPALRERYGLVGRVTCAYVGTIGMASGLDVVLRAARLLKQRNRDDIRFLLVGDGAVKPDLEAVARAEGLDNVIFTGRQPKSAIPAILASIEVCLVHLKREELFKSVLPSKIFESAGMAKPVILGVEGSAAELLRDAGGGITIEPENAEQLVTALERLAADPELGRQYGRSSQAYVQKHFDRDDLSDQYLDVLRETVRDEAGS
jgi:glycosyltransferase involved in cell wall biosynthesis